MINLNKLKEDHIKKIDNEIIKYNNKIEELSKDKIASFEELKGVFITQLSKCQIRENGASVSPWKITTFEGINFSDMQHPFNKYDRYGRLVGVLLPEGKEILTPRGERFSDVEKRLIDREHGEKEEAAKKIAELTKEKQDILQWNFKNIVDAEGADICFNENLNEDYRRSIKMSLNDDEGFLKFLSSKFVDVIAEEDVVKLENAYRDFISKEMPEEKINTQINYLKFLVAQNYIDEHFIEYTSNYKAEVLSPLDVKVVQGIQRRVLKFDVPIDSIKNIYDWLDDEDFKYVSILNKSIIDSIDLIQSMSKNNNDYKFKYLTALLADTASTKVNETLIEYIIAAEAEKIDNLIKYLISRRKNLISDILSNNKVSVEHKDVALAAAIKYSSNLNEICGSTDIQEYVENSLTYLKTFATVGDNGKVREFLNQLKPKFKHLSIEGRGDVVQEYIVAEKMYEINLANIVYILNVDTSDKANKFFSGNFTFILSSKNDALISYIKTDINNYVKNVLLNSEITCEDEDEKNVISLLTNNVLSDEKKISLLHKVKLHLQDITQFSPELYETIFVTDNVEPSWFNIEWAYQTKGFDCVIEFIKKHDNIFGEFLKLSGIKQETSDGLFKNILLQFRPEEIYKIVKTLPAKIKLSAIISDISEDNLLSSIESKGISYDNSDLKKLISNLKLTLAYVRVYAEDILVNFDNVMPPNLSQELIANIISDKNINSQLRDKVIDKYKNYIVISGYAQKYAEYILEGHSVPASILWQFSAESIDKETKLQILINCNYGGVLPDNAKLKEYIMSLGDSYKAMFDGKTKEIRVPNTKDDKQLLQFLKDNNIIINYQKARKKEQYIAKILNVS